jgi:DNA repair exonuclease SbcCD ATPase subunit
MSTEQDSRPSFFVRFLRFIVRLLFVLIIGIALGVGIFFGVTTLYRVYIKPAQMNTVRLDTAEIQLEQLDEFVSDRSDDLSARIDTLEMQGDNNKTTFYALESRLAALETAQAEQDEVLVQQSDAQAALEDDLLAVQGSYEQLQTELDALGSQVQSLDTELSGIEDELQTLDENLQTLSGEIERIESLAALVEVNEQRQIAVENEFQLLRTMAMLTRSRMHLANGNTTLASADILVARELLVSLQAELPDFQAQTLQETIDQLDAALSFLPRSPLQASDRLEGAWDLLLNGLPSEATATEGTPTPESEQGSAGEATPTPTPTS